MKRTTAPTPALRPARPERLRLRYEATAPAQLARVHVPSHAAHDFLVPNPRPDLTLGVHTLRMIEAG